MDAKKFFGKEVKTPHGNGICVGEVLYDCAVYLFGDETEGSYHDAKSAREDSPFIWPKNKRTYYIPIEKVTLVPKNERRFKFNIGDKVIHKNHGEGIIVGIQMFGSGIGMSAPYIVASFRNYGVKEITNKDSCILTKDYNMKNVVYWSSEKNLILLKDKKEKEMKLKLGDPVYYLGNKGYIAGIDHSCTAFKYVVYCENIPDEMPFSDRRWNLNNLKKAQKGSTLNWELGYGPDNDNYIWATKDEVQRIPVKKEKYPDIHIGHNGKHIIAEIVENGRRYVGIASCAPEDEFNYSVGVKLAVERLMENYEQNNMED